MHTRGDSAMEKSLDYIFKERLVNLIICLRANLL